MKKIFLSLVVLSFLIGALGALAENDNLPYPGITPDSPLYFLKAWKETIQTFFIFGAENKAKQYLHLADVRLAEYQKMAEKGKTEIAQKTIEKYEKQLNHALQKVEELKTKGKDTKDISQKLEDTLNKHIDVLERNLQKVPESAKKGIERALESSRKGAEKAKNLLKKKEICLDNCGNGICEEVVCTAEGCPCPETKESCPQDCGTAMSDKERACLSSGGKISTSLCCKSTADFPNLCLIGPCGCSPENSHEVKICDCEEGKCFDGEKCVEF